MKVLVTGASGFIGSHLVSKLLDRGHDVRTISRHPLNGSVPWARQVEHCCADISDSDKMSQAAQGIELIFHLAGLISYRKSALSKQQATNIEGTKNVMQAALDNGVKRVVHTSSIAGMGIPEPGIVADENIVYNLDGKGLTYCDTKHAGETVVMEYHNQGLPVIMLNPGIILGENDSHPHHHVIFRAIASGLLLGCPSGGVMFSDIEDVISAHLAAMTRGTPGHRYVIGNANLSYIDAARSFSSVFGSRPPKFLLPSWLISSAAFASEGMASLLRTEPVFTKQMAWLAQQKIFFSWSKAERELGYSARPFEDTITRVAPHYLKNGH
jgi:dihydroflavonol-4-reductase